MVKRKSSSSIGIGKVGRMVMYGGMLYSSKKRVEMEIEARRLMGYRFIGGIEGIEKLSDIVYHQVSYIRGKILQVIVRRGMSIRDLSEKSGVSYKKLSKFFRCKGEISVSELERVLVSLELVFMMIDKDVFDFADLDIVSERIRRYRRMRLLRKIEDKREEGIVDE